VDRIFVRGLSPEGDGIRVAVKDSIDIAGLPTCCGSAALADAPAAAEDAAVVALLRAGGARIMGKANMHELAYGVTGMNRWTGTPPNPRYPGRIPGGSSSGSAAAVAAGLADIGIGTDTGGSIRMPAACCGIFGLKPSIGRVSRAGVVCPASSSLDCVGPMARDMAMLTKAMSLIDPSFVAEDAPGDPVLGMVTAAANPDIEGVIEKTVLASGMSARSVQLPLMSEAFDAALAIIGAENWVAFGHLVDAPGLGPDVRARLHAASGITARQLAAAEAVRTRFRREVDEALCGVGALVLPTLPIVPPMLQEAANAAAMIPVTALLRPFNLSGHPALTIPLQTAAGLPAGLQLVARQGADAALCALGTLLAVRLGIQIDPATAG